MKWKLLLAFNMAGLATGAYQLAAGNIALGLAIEAGNSLLVGQGNSP
jgi:hypothetical protein